MTPSRRQFLTVAAGAVASAVLPVARAAENPAKADSGSEHGPAADRAYWTAMLTRVAEPVLAAIAANKLRAKMPVEAPASTAQKRGVYTHLEAFGRTVAGVAPWLELAEDSTEEGVTRQRLAELVRQGLGNATDPKAPDFLNFTDPTHGTQPLVDAAFLALGLLRAPRTLWGKLDPAVQARVIACLEETRAMPPGLNNWVMFSATIEAFLASAGAKWDAAPIERALSDHQQWYKGDGVYGDGPEFHWDYYNSFVIQPMLITVVEQMSKVTDQWKAQWAPVLARAQRYAAIEERLIAPDGTYPPLGRSITYRCGAFQLLALMALRGQLPEGVTPAQVRGGLTAVIRRTLGAPETFDAQGWLRVGLAGHQPGLAENYISTGSLYLCTCGFLPLGLPASDGFWTSAPAPWTQVKVWAGQDLKGDHALPNSS